MTGNNERKNCMEKKMMNRSDAKYFILSQYLMILNADDNVEYSSTCILRIEKARTVLEYNIIQGI